MDPDLQAESDGLQPIEIIRDPEIAAAVLKPPRPAILAALCEPASASGLTRVLGIPRQRLNHHIRELEAVGLVRLVEQRQRRGCVERVMQATARRYALSPEILGELGNIEPEDVLALGSFGWPPLVAIAGQTIRNLAILRDHLGDGVPALMFPAQVRFSSPEAFDEFIQELSDEIGRLLAKYHDESASTGSHVFFLGAYPGVAASEEA